MSPRSGKLGEARSSAAFAVGLVMIGALYCFYYASREKIFYYWDYALYHNLTKNVVAAFGNGFSAGVAYVRSTLGADYNVLFTLPLLPLVELFGTERGVYLAAVYLVYFVPLLYISGLLLRRLFPGFGNWAVWVGALAAFLSAHYWRTILRGYPDTCGAALIALGVLLHVTRPAGDWRFRRSVLLGAVLGTSVLLRRHFAYGAVAFFAALALDTLLAAFDDPAVAARARLRKLGHRALHLVVSGLASVGLVALVIPSFISRALVIATSNIYSSWEQGPARVAMSVLEKVGAVPALLALAGGVIVWRQKPESRPMLRFLALLTSCWVLVWVFVVREDASHYPHVVPLVTALGIGALVLWMLETPTRRRIWSAAGVSFVVFCLFLQATSSAAAFKPLHRLPQGVAPLEFWPLRSAGFHQIASLVSYLREVAKPGARIVVAASSDELNDDLMRNAESTLFDGPPHLDFLAMPQVDSLGELPTSALISADFVIVAIPFQDHLGADRQKVVHVLEAAFEEGWEIAGDYEKLPREFHVPPSNPLAPPTVHVWKRIRPTSPEVARKTVTRMSFFVSGHPPDGVWYPVSSRFPSNTSLNRDGSSQLKAHPAATGTQPETAFEAPPTAGGTAAVSGLVQFMDRRCAGAELVLTTDAPDSQVQSVGAFAPGPGPAPFRQTIATDGHALRLLVRSSPSNRENISYCSLTIDELRVTQAVP